MSESDAARTRVLLVEDSPEDADLIAEALADGACDARERLFDLIHVDRLSAGLEQLRRGGIGLVLVDLSLPDSHGIETFLRVREAAPDLPIVVLSGLSDEAVAVRTVREGAQDYIVKGTTDGRLLVRSFRYAVERKRAEVAHANFVREQAAREEAEAALKLRDDFLAAASHDLKTPLTAVKTSAQLLRRVAQRDGTVPLERLMAGLRTIETTADRMTAQVNELLDVARLRMGQPLSLDLAPTDLVAIARRAVEVHQATSDVHRLQVSSSVEQIVGSWDAVRLQRVLDNLLSNALKYSPAGGVVVVDISHEPCPDGGCAVLSVRDRGVGIPQEDLPHIFDRFHRAGNVVGRITGVGLGLAVVRQIVEQHGGCVAADSRVGEGSRFTVRLPLSAAAAALAPA